MSDTHTLRCADVTPYLSAFVDGELAEPLRSQVAAHVATCDTCAQQVARIAAVDRALAALPRTAPSPQVFKRVAAAVAQKPREATVREPVGAGGRFRLGGRRLEIPRWGTRDARPLPTMRPSGMPRWAAGAVPAIAALLLISLALFVFRGVIDRGQSTTTHPTPTPTVATSQDALAQTKAKIDDIRRAGDLAFDPVAPTYLPPGASLAGDSPRVTRIGEGGSGPRLLDVTWTFASGPVERIMLREAPSGYEWYGYKAIPNPGAGYTWQIGQSPWVALANNSNPAIVAFGQDRGGLSLVVAAVPRGDLGQAAVLGPPRLISLSMDRKYLAPPQIGSAPAANLILHYQAWMSTKIGSGPTVDGYSYPDQQAQRVDVTAQGGTHYIDVARNGQVIRLDVSHKSYSRPAAGDLTPTQPETGVTQVFFGGSTFVSNGQLWYNGEATDNGARVYDFLVVSAQYETHVHVSESTKQVLKVVVNTDQRLGVSGPYPPLSLVPSTSCPRYTLIEYLQPSQVPGDSLDAFFWTTPPGDYKPGTSPPTVTCPAN